MPNSELLVNCKCKWNDWVFRVSFCRCNANRFRNFHRTTDSIGNECVYVCGCVWNITWWKIYKSLVLEISFRSPEHTHTQIAKVYENLHILFLCLSVECNLLMDIASNSFSSDVGDSSLLSLFLLLDSSDAWYTSMWSNHEIVFILQKRCSLHLKLYHLPPYSCCSWFRFGNR